MAQALSVRLTIPIVDDARTDRPLVFSRWLPLQDEDALAAFEDGIDLSFWIDEHCFSHIGELDLEEVAKYGNIFVGKLHVDATGLDVDDDLATTITKLAAETNWVDEHLHPTYGSPLIEAYDTTGRRIYLAAVKQFNRLIAFVRAAKGQYWLQEYNSDPYNLSSEFVKLKALAKVGDSDWVRLSSTGGIKMTLTLPRGPKLITQDDWPSIREHLSGDRKPPLALQLLATSEAFRDEGHRRAALTEAVSALEVAVNAFGRNADSETWSRLFGDFFSESRLHNHIDHLGKTCTIAYLFPVIFDESQMPRAILKACWEAIEERNSVVHRGQRDVDDEKLGAYLGGIREFCEKLDDLESR